MTNSSLETIQFTASDGWQLEGDLHRSSIPTTAILISAGTGYKRQFYRHLAAWLADQGAVVLTYDYRGIGASRHGDIAHSTIDYQHWGQYDMTAALDALDKVAPDLPVYHIGHSVGAQFAGFMSNHGRIDRHAFLSAGSGYWGSHHKTRWALEMFFWWGLGTWSLNRHGYIKDMWGYTGEHLPPEVFKTWRRWSQKPTYNQKELETGLQPHFFDGITAPICAWNFPDDGIATPAARDVTLSCYKNAPVTRVIRSAKDLGMKKIGHDRSVRPGAEALWTEIWQWLSAGQQPVTIKTAA